VERARLSGGGIRSAALSLGVLQAFAEADILRRFDYISSVSGGGYLGGSLQWWWSKRRHESPDDPNAPGFGLGRDDFPYGPARISRAAEAEITTKARANLQFLRTHSSYLTPGNGLSSWSMLGVVVRTAVISILIWIPLIAAFFAALPMIDRAWLQTFANQYELWSPIAGLIPARWEEACHGVECELRCRAIYALMLYVFYGMTAAFFFAALIFAFMSRTPTGTGPNWSIITLTAMSMLIGGVIYRVFAEYGLDRLDGSLLVLVVMGLLVIAIAVVTILVEAFTTRSLNASYLLRRSLEKILGKAFIPSLLFLATATIPIVPYLLSTSEGVPGKGIGALSLLSGVGSAAYGYYTFRP
jgi:hypothetical protein